jgi:hypothetical protein
MSTSAPTDFSTDAFVTAVRVSANAPSAEAAAHVLDKIVAMVDLGHHPAPAGIPFFSEDWKTR